MIERNRFMDVLAHAVLILGVMVVAFPVYLTFVASTHTAQEVVQVPMPLWPGEHLLDNYKTALLGDAAKQVSDMAQDDCQSQRHQRLDESGRFKIGLKLFQFAALPQD